MTRRVNKVFKKHKNIFTVIFFFIFLVLISVKAVNAFYNNTSTPAQLVRSLVGDFEAGDGDIVIEVYRENSYQSGVYVKNYYIPNNTLYSLDSVDCSIDACETTNTSGDCHYSYNSANNEITVTSREKLTCKFYFDKLVDDTDADIQVYIMKEDLNSITNPKTYLLTNSIPAIGYIFSSITCDNGVTPTYDPTLRKFNFSTTSKTVCYAYFDALTGAADIIGHIYVQSAANSDTYVEVDTIPSNVQYQISTNQNFASNCMTMTTPSVPSTPPTMDEQGYIVINATEKVTCTVYLDIVE